MAFNPNLIQEIEQAVLQKQSLVLSLANPQLESSQKTQTNQKIAELNIFLNKFYAVLDSNQNPNLNTRATLNELNLQGKLENVQKNLTLQIQQNLELQNTLKNYQTKIGNEAKIANIINQNTQEVKDQLKHQIELKNAENNTDLNQLKPKTLKQYLYLGWDYLVRDRLPKLLSTRLFLVIGGGYITEKLGTDTTLKIISIVILVVFYILSEMIVKLASKPDKGLSLY